MKERFRIAIEGDIPEGDSDVGPHAHVAVMEPVDELVKLVTQKGVLNVVRVVGTIKRNRPAEVAPSAPKLVTGKDTPSAA